MCGLVAHRGWDRKLGLMVKETVKSSFLARGDRFVLKVNFIDYRGDGMYSHVSCPIDRGCSPALFEENLACDLPDVEDVRSGA